MNNDRQDFNLVRFIFYCISYLLVGSLMFGFGPLIPYYMASRHRTAQDYSIVMFARMVGYLVGNLFVKILQKRILMNQSLAIGLIVAGVFAIIFNEVESTLLFECITFGISSAGIALFDVYTNIGVVKSSGKDFESRLQILHSFLNIGGLLASVVVYFIGLHTYLVFGIACLILAVIFLFFIESPENDIQQNQIFAQQQENQDQNLRSLKFKIVILLCISTFFQIGIESTFATWISSYAVLRKLNTKQGATLYTFLFLASTTVFRIMFSFIGGKPSSKIAITTFIGSILSIGVLFIIYDLDSSFGLIFTSITLGFVVAPLFVLLLGIPNENGISLSQSKIAAMLIAGVCGQGLITVPVGMLFKPLTPQVLFYTISLCFAMIFIVNLIIKILIRNIPSQQEHKFEIQDTNLDKEKEEQKQKKIEKQKEQYLQIKK